MARRVVLHIGTEKTGSTSIQRTIARNAEMLDSHGWIFPAFKQQKKGTNNPRSLKTRMNWKDVDDPGWDILASGLDALEDGQTMVISNEGMYRTTQGLPSEKLAQMLRGFEVKVILYVREQADYLQSMMLQNQKKKERATNFEEPAFLERLLRRRNLNYFHLCSQLEKTFGTGTVEARLFKRSNLIDEDVVIDFFATAGYEHADQLVVPAISNASLSVQMAHALRTLPGEKQKGYRYVDLLDAALRLSYNGVGDKYFISQTDVAVLRARYAQSNWRFAQNYLANADEVPESPAWRNDSAMSIDEAQEQLHSLVTFAPRVAGGWNGGRNIGLRLFVEGWKHDIVDTNLRASLASDEAVLKIRFPFARRFERLDRAALTLGFPDKPSGTGRCDITVNDKPIGRVDLFSEPIIFDCALLEPLDTAEIRLEPHPDDFIEPAWVDSIDINYLR